MDFLKLKDKIHQQILNRDYPDNTAQTYSKIVADMSQYYSNDKPEDFKFEDIRKYIHHQWKVAKRPANTVNLMYAALKFYYNELLKKKFQFDLIVKPHKERRVVEILTTHEIQKMFDATKNLKTKAIMALAYGCGLEIGEVLSLKFSDINPKTNTVLVRNKKKKITKELFIPTSIIELIRKYHQEHRPKTWLFEGNTANEPYSQRSALYLIKTVTDKAELPKPINLTILKYCYIKHTEEMGIPIAVILNTLELNHTSSYEYYSQIGIDPEEKVRVSPYDRLFKKQVVTKKSLDEFWEILHPQVKSLAHGKFTNKYYADSVETCLKEINSIVKKIVKNKTSKEFDGTYLLSVEFRRFVTTKAIVITH